MGNNTGKQLEDNRKVADYDLRDTIHLLLRLRYDTFELIYLTVRPPPQLLKIKFLSWTSQLVNKYLMLLIFH